MPLARGAARSGPGPPPKRASTSGAGRRRGTKKPVRGPGGNPSSRRGTEFDRNISLRKLRIFYFHTAGIMALEVWGWPPILGCPCHRRVQRCRGASEVRGKDVSRGASEGRDTNRDPGVSEGRGASECRGRGESQGTNVDRGIDIGRGVSYNRWVNEDGGSEYERRSNRDQGRAESERDPTG